jgi:MFS family permease
MLATHWGTRIGILTLAHVMGTVPIVSVMAIAPVLRPELGLSVTQVGLLVSGYYTAQTIGALPAGRWHSPGPRASPAPSPPPPSWASATPS